MISEGQRSEPLSGPNETVAKVPVPREDLAKLRGLDARAEVTRCVATLWEPGAVGELRILDAKRRCGIVSGYFDDREALVKEILRWDGQATGIYLLPLNPAFPEPLRTLRYVESHAGSSACRGEWAAWVARVALQNILSPYAFYYSESYPTRATSATRRRKPAALMAEPRASLSARAQ